jgi:hypothetical protein
MTDYSAIIPLWPILSGREKFNALARLRNMERKRAARKARTDASKVQKRVYDEARRKEKQAKKAEAWNPPGGYYPMTEIVERNNTAVSSVKRYISRGDVRIYKHGGRVVICEYDVILAIEAGIEARRENGRRRKA